MGNNDEHMKSFGEKFPEIIKELFPELEEFKTNAEDALLPPVPEGWVTLSSANAQELLDKLNALAEYQLNDSDFISVKSLTDACHDLTDEDAEQLLWDCDGFVVKRGDARGKFFIKIRDITDEPLLGYITRVKRLASTRMINISQDIKDKFAIYSGCFVNKESAVDWIDKKTIPFTAQVRGLTDFELERIRESIRLKAQNAIQDTYEITNRATKPDAILKVKRRVANVADKAVCGRNTRNENKVALEWIVYWRSQKRSEKDIANTLFKAGAGNAVIGYLLAPEGEDLSKIDNDAARKRGQRAREGKMELDTRTVS